MTAPTTEPGPHGALEDRTAPAPPTPTSASPSPARWWSRLDLRALVAFAGLLAAFLGVWELTIVAGLLGPLAPAPLDVGARAVELAAGAFQGGRTSAGLALQLLSSLGRVVVGFGLAVVVAVPVGFAVGTSPTLSRAVDPFVQVLRPVSPLAWLPIGLALLESSQATAIFVIFMSALWPILLNTILGVRGVPRRYLELARTLEAGRGQVVRRILLPGALPSIVTGLRLSLGIAWLVIVAAEMLLGGRGIGYFVWNQWNNLDIAAIVVAILAIGVVGLVLDRGVRRIERALGY